MSDEEDKDYEDFIKKIMDDMNIDADVFDAEFIIFTSKDLNKKFGLDPEDKGFKVRFHYEEGMDKPEIKVSKRDDLDQDKLKDLLKKMRFVHKSHPKIKKVLHSHTKDEVPKVIDAKDLSLTAPNEPQNTQNVITREPDVEVQDFGEKVEVILEVPGVCESDLFLSLSEEKDVLTFNADNNEKSYYKKIQLPTKCSILNDSICVNNGILSITLSKRD